MEPVRIRCGGVSETCRVVEALVAQKTAREKIEVFSAEPIHDLEPLLAGRSHLRYYVLSGALIGAIAGYLMASVTAQLYPLNTGGMPIVAPLPFGIVTYEAMMLLAILFSLVGFLLEAKLLRRRPPEHSDHAVAIADGEIHVLVQVESEAEARKIREVARVT